MKNYNKLIQSHASFDYPYLTCAGWRITRWGILVPNIKDYITPGSFDLLRWKAAFYDRGHKANIREEYCGCNIDHNRPRLT